ncbi:hypothetical protein [Parablautia muri]|uniref:hypothetical protein n=1 Tax=Parablautia muri TaxID=2320879 RepID=UPI001370E532|nr:hypothetical protein [Parablautia muri]
MISISPSKALEILKIISGLSDADALTEFFNLANPDSRKRDDEFSPHLAEFPEFY